VISRLPLYVKMGGGIACVLVFPLPSAFSHSVGAVGPAWLCFVFFVFSFFASDMVGGSFWGE